MPTAAATGTVAATGPLIDGLLPYIIAAVGGLISVVGTVVAVWLKQKFNIEIEAKDREAWQQSATNAAGALIARGAVKIEEGTGKIGAVNLASPYPFKTAAEHYQAWLKDAKGGTKHTKASIPDWSGRWDGGGGGFRLCRCGDWCIGGHGQHGCPYSMFASPPPHCFHG